VLTLFRVLRILRVTRILRLMRQRDLWMLIQGLIACRKTFIWAMVLLNSFLYVAAEERDLHAITPASSQLNPDLRGLGEGV